MTGIPLDLFFLASVFLIWTMLVYQFVLAFAGYLYSRESARERAMLDQRHLEFPSLSILIPAHNEELVIERTVRKILASEYPHDKLEIIVMNDGSSDRTAEILNKLAQEFPNVRPVHIPKGEGGKGKAHVLNRALKLTKQEMIAIYDADNQPEPRALVYLAAQFTLNPKLGAALGKFRTLNKKKNLLTRFINIEEIGRAHV